MTRRRTIVGLCFLCALAAGAVAAQGAVASKGTTAFTCKEKKEKGGVGFSKAHCKPGDAVGSGAAFEHVAVAEGTTTELSGTNSKTGSSTESTTAVKLRNTQAGGVDYEIVAGKVSGVGSVTNARDLTTGEHYVHGTAVVVFEEVAVTKPSGKGCKTKEAKIESKLLKATTRGQGDFLNFEPAEGSVMASYTLEGCVPESLNGVQEVTGSIKCPVDGATVTCTHSETTALGTLKERGFKSGIEGTMTLSAKDSAAGDSVFTPLSATTVETP
jgi:hypothetical protein